MAFPKNCFNPTCKCKKMEIQREVTLRCKNCNCGVKIEVKQIVFKKKFDGLISCFEKDLVISYCQKSKE